MGCTTQLFKFSKNKQAKLATCTCFVVQTYYLLGLSCCLYLFHAHKDKTEQGRTISIRSVEAVLHRPLLSRRNFTVIFNFAFLKSIVHIPRGGSSQQISFDSHHHWHCNALVARTLCPLTASVPVPRQVWKHSYFRIPGLSSYPLHIIT